MKSLSYRQAYFKTQCITLLHPTWSLDPKIIVKRHLFLIFSSLLSLRKNWQAVQNLNNCVLSGKFSVKPCLWKRFCWMEGGWWGKHCWHGKRLHFSKLSNPITVPRSWKDNLGLLVDKSSLQRWHRNYDPIKDSLKLVRLWIQLPRLPLELKWIYSS